MNNGPSITNADENNLANLIHAATRRVVYMAPGISESVADALSNAWTRLGTQAVSIILDVDPEICRLGYGTCEGLKRTYDAAGKLGVQIGQQPGVRIGLLISDDITLIYSPTPLLIEEGTNLPQRPNAIRLEAPPTQLAKDIGLGENGIIERTVGLSPVSYHKIQAVEADLANAPPVKFDLARRVRVFTSQFQFVELTMSGCFISRKKVPIPSSLIGLSKSGNLERQFHTSFELIPKGKLEIKTSEKTISEQSLLLMRRSIEKRFLTVLPGYGQVIRRSNREAFDKEIAILEADVEIFADGVKAELQKHMDNSREAVVNALFPSLRENPPDEYKKIHGQNPPEEFLRTRLDEDIQKAFGSADNLVTDMKVKLVFKEVAYESLIDKKFLETARKAMHGIKFLHEEYDAAQPAQSSGSSGQ
ncbi:MAG: hypothetical protein AB2L11_13600 [Syntrophobacteraceae bacterium]